MLRRGPGQATRGADRNEAQGCPFGNHGGSGRPFAAGAVAGWVGAVVDAVFIVGPNLNRNLNLNLNRFSPKQCGAVSLRLSAPSVPGSWAAWQLASRNSAFLSRRRPAN